MDDSEKLAYEYLMKRGFPPTDISYEPDGKVPPDFLVEGRIAVEVRRLNQNEKSARGWRGFEEDILPIQMKIRRLLATFGPANDGASWFVSCTVKRPFPPTKQLAAEISDGLREFQNHPPPKPVKISVARSLGLRFVRTSKTHPNMFVPGGLVDRGSGCFVVSALAENLKMCIEEKTQKVARVRNKYPEWWFLLVDRISYGDLDENDLRLLGQIFRREDNWDKVILISPIDPTWGIEL